MEAKNITGELILRATSFDGSQFVKQDFAVGSKDENDPVRLRVVQQQEGRIDSFKYVVNGEEESTKFAIGEVCSKEDIEGYHPDRDGEYIRERLQHFQTKYYVRSFSNTYIVLRPGDYVLDGITGEVTAVMEDQWRIKFLKPQRPPMFFESGGNSDVTFVNFSNRRIIRRSDDPK